MLTYVNPYLSPVPPSEKAGSRTHYDFALEKGYLITDVTNQTLQSNKLYNGSSCLPEAQGGRPLLLPSATDDFLFAMPDFSRAEVRQWFSERIIRCSVLELKENCTAAYNSTTNSAGAKASATSSVTSTSKTADAEDADENFYVSGFMADFSEYMPFPVAELNERYGLAMHNK